MWSWRNWHKRIRHPSTSTSCGSDAEVRPDETRKAERGHARIRQQIRIVGHEIVDPTRQRDVPHTCFCESFADRSGEGFLVNSRLSQSLFCV